MVLFIHLHGPHASSPTRFVWNILLYIHRSPLEHVKKHHMGALMIHRPSSNNSTMRYMKNLSPKLINVEHFGFPCVSINHWDQILNKEHLHWNRFFIGAHNLPINESHGVAFEKVRRVGYLEKEDIHKEKHLPMCIKRARIKNCSRVLKVHEGEIIEVSSINH